MQKLIVVDRCVQVRQQHWRGIFAILVHWLASGAKSHDFVGCMYRVCVCRARQDKLSTKRVKNDTQAVHLTKHTHTHRPLELRWGASWACFHCSSSATLRTVRPSRASPRVHRMPQRCHMSSGVMPSGIMSKRRIATGVMSAASCWSLSHDDDVYYYDGERQCCPVLGQEWSSCSVKKE